MHGRREKAINRAKKETLDICRVGVKRITFVEREGYGRKKKAGKPVGRDGRRQKNPVKLPKGKKALARFRQNGLIFPRKFKDSKRGEVFGSRKGGSKTQGTEVIGGDKEKYTAM